jgi:hypothetical protein
MTGGGSSGRPGKRTGPTRSFNTERLARMTSRQGASPRGREPYRTHRGPVRSSLAATRAATRAAAGRAARAAWRKGTAGLASTAGTPVLGAAVRAGQWVVERFGARRLALGVLAALLLMCCLPVAITTALLSAWTGTQPTTAVGCPGGGGELAGADLASLDPEQRANGELIVTVGMDLRTPPRAWVIAVATATQESSLRNLPHLGADNDHDSLGLFQQRPSQGWGSAEQILDPVYSSTAFYQRLLEVEGWDTMPLTRAAQAVQRSAFPDAYAAHEGLATSLVNSVSGGVSAVAAFDGDPRCAQWYEVTAAGWTVPAPGPVWSGFRTRNRPDHYGVDIGSVRSTAIRAAADGRVIRSTCHATRNGQPYSCDVDGSPEVTGCGWYVEILHPGDVVTRYCHLEAQPSVVAGEQVAAGQLLGQVGSSGDSSGPHLHFEVEVRIPQRHTSGVTVERIKTDPVAFLAVRGVLLRCTNGPADCEPVHGDHTVR